MATSSPPCPPQPTCGPQGATTDSVGAVILLIIGIVGTTATVISLIANAAEKTVLPILGIAGQGIVLIGLGAAAGAAFVLGTTIAFLIERCLADPDGRDPSCSAGVVSHVLPSFNRPADYLFPFIAQHDSVIVVVKCMYWPLVQDLAKNILCTGSPDKSPAIRCYYENKAVCAAAWGSAIGALVGGVGGTVLGILAGASLGCAGTGPFYFFCLLIALIIAAIVAAVIALAGAFIGGNIGHAAAGSSAPTGDGGKLVQGGDYITTKGKTIIRGGDHEARVYWFVTHTTLHGRSAINDLFRSHTDPDVNLKEDACPRGSGHLR